MKNFIKKRLLESIRHLPDTTFNQELKYQSNKPLSLKKVDINKIRYKLTMATTIANNYFNETGDNIYFNSPTDGDGYYQLEIRHDGNLRIKHIKPSPDMNQLNTKFHPTDVGSCKDFQSIARYCFVKAGKPIKGKYSYGASPAEDAANKALIIFKDDILAFLSDSKLDPNKGKEMSPELSKHKIKKDLESEIGHKLTDQQWNNYLQTGEKPHKKQPVSVNQKELDDFEQRQRDAMQRREKALKRLYKS